MNNILFYTVTAFALIIIIGLCIMDDRAMNQCLNKNSFETCYSELHR